MKKLFVTGLIILLPIAITILVVTFLIDTLTAPFDGLIQVMLSWLGEKSIELQKHTKILHFIIRILTLIFLFFVIILLGLLARRYLFKLMIRYTHFIFEKLPGVRYIYRLTKEVTQQFLDEKQKPFKNPVLLPFPSEKSRALGFKTAPVPRGMKTKLKGFDNAWSVFVPTSPHPISGFVLITKEEDTSSIPINAEDLLKFLVSCGIFDPQIISEEDPPKENETNSSHPDKE